MKIKAGDTMGIDINGLKNELKQDSYGAFF